MPELRAPPLLRVAAGGELRLPPDREVTAREPPLLALPALPPRTTLRPAEVAAPPVLGAACPRDVEAAGRAPRTTHAGRACPELAAPSGRDALDVPATTLDGAGRRAPASLPRGVELTAPGPEAAAGGRSEAGTERRGEDASTSRPSSAPSSLRADGR